MWLIPSYMECVAIPAEEHPPVPIRPVPLASVERVTVQQQHLPRTHRAGGAALDVLRDYPTLLRQSERRPIRGPLPLQV